MARTSKSSDLIQTTHGQHLALSVAAHLARTQLVPDRFNTYDGRHMLDTLDVVANALLRVTPVYATDMNKKEPRQLTDAELQGAKVKNAAQNLILGDGRNLSAITVKRSDLRQAIGILKAVGIPELLVRPTVKDGESSDNLPSDRTARLFARISEVEQLLRYPLSPERKKRADQLVIDIARIAPYGHISNLAMRLMSSMHEARDEGDEERMRIILARLRSAVEETRKTQYT